MNRRTQFYVDNAPGSDVQALCPNEVMNAIAPWPNIVRVRFEQAESINRRRREEITLVRTSHSPGLREKIAELNEEEYHMKTETKQKAAVALIAGAATVMIGGQVAQAATLHSERSASDTAVVAVSDQVVRPGVALW